MFTAVYQMFVVLVDGATPMKMQFDQPIQALESAVLQAAIHVVTEVDTWKAEGEGHHPDYHNEKMPLSLIFHVFLYLLVP